MTPLRHDPERWASPTIGVSHTGGRRSPEMFELALDLEAHIDELPDALDRIRETITALAELAPNA